MGKLAIIGASGHGKTVADAALSTNTWSNISFFDDKFPEIPHLEHWKVCGALQDFIDCKHKYDAVIVAVGNNKIRAKIYQELELNRCSFATIIHSSAIVSPYTKIASGTVILAGAVINPFVNIGRSCIVNTNANIDHDCILEDFVHISPGVNIAGNVKIGSYTWVGIGATIINNIMISNNIIVGAASVVINDLVDEGTYVGNPSYKIKG